MHSYSPLSGPKIFLLLNHCLLIIEWLSIIVLVITISSQGVSSNLVSRLNYVKKYIKQVSYFWINVFSILFYNLLYTCWNLLNRKLWDYHKLILRHLRHIINQSKMQGSFSRIDSTKSKITLSESLVFARFQIKPIEIYNL